MPELPDLTVYREQLARRVEGHELRRIRLASPFVLRTVTPAVLQLAQTTTPRWVSLQLNKGATFCSLFSDSF